MNMNKKMNQAAFMMMAALTMASCGTSKKAQDTGVAQRNANDMVTMDDEGVDNCYLILSDAQRDVVTKNNEFAFRLFNKMAGMDSKVISPMSVAYLMGMLANGADGATQQEILKAIGCEGVSLDDLNETYKAILQAAGKLDKQTIINIANYIAVNQKFSVEKEFCKKVGESYHAGIERLDFQSAETTKRINNWCSKNTHGMIPQIIDQVDPSAVSYLMNAIYFNGIWQNKFDAKQTKLENFSGYTRNIQKVDMMHQTKKLYYAENDIYKAVELPYGNGTYRMLVLLPNEDKSILEMMKDLDAQKLDAINKEMQDCIVNLKLPKFTIEQEIPLNAIVSELGAPSMFEQGKANFTRFASGEFFVSKMIQKAKIEVTEQGTKAAAVTAAVMLTSAAPVEMRQVEFFANRPFVYMIQDTQSGGILFMGQYTGADNM